MWSNGNFLLCWRYSVTHFTYWSHNVWVRSACTYCIQTWLSRITNLPWVMLEHIIINILWVSFKFIFWKYCGYYTGCGRNNSLILNVNKNQMKQGTQENLLFIKSTYDAFFFQILLKITSLKCRPLLMTHSWSRSRKLSMALRVIAGGMAATYCRIASFNCSIVPGRRASPWNL